MKNKRVVVAMSGGVDSSLAASLLKQQGFEVIGITMCFGTAVGKPSKRPVCCGPEAISDARRAADILGIRHYVLNFSRALEKYVINDFLNEYLAGRTPNPCVRCNKFIKFGMLLDKAHKLDAEFLATGHYARIQRKKDGQYLLKKGKDLKKEQSYFLYSIDRKILPFILFPVGEYTKAQVRRLAKEFNIPVHEKPASQEICFIPDNDYPGFLRQRLGRMRKKIKPGPILDIQGKVLGQHEGIAYYTIGQRQGLGLALGEPHYVVKIDKSANSVILGKERDTYFKGLIADNLNFLLPLKNRRLDVNVKIRYNQQEVKSHVVLSKLPSARNINSLIVEVRFFKPIRSVAAGQSVVFYGNDLVIGGGIIREGIK